MKYSKLKKLGQEALTIIEKKRRAGAPLGEISNFLQKNHFITVHTSELCRFFDDNFIKPLPKSLQSGKSSDMKDMRFNKDRRKFIMQQIKNLEGSVKKSDLMKPQ